MGSPYTGAYGYNVAGGVLFQEGVDGRDGRGQAGSSTASGCKLDPAVTWLQHDSVKLDRSAVRRVRASGFG